MLTAVEDATFEVAANAFTSLIGPSGCGKSTILKAVAGLVRCSSGQLTIDSVPVSGPGPDRAIVFQSPALLPWRSVLRNVTYGLEIRGLSRREAADQALRLLELVGLADFANSYPHQLSGGMQQRVNLARALAVQPEVLLLDEPFSALDAQTRELLGYELLAIWERQRTTALFVTHQIDEAVFLSDTVIVFSRGPASRVVSTVEVRLPRPRTAAMRDSPEFQSLVANLRELLMS
jgi:NitT/TauT family transport system ATP-binding protein